MPDKVQKIKEWISKEQDGLIDAQGNFEYPEHEGAYHILCNLDTYIDSLQEEPVSEDILDVSRIDYRLQHKNIEDGIKYHAEEYSFNIESVLYNQLTNEQQELWRKELERAVISGGYYGLELSKDKRYKENSVSEELEEACEQLAENARKHKAETSSPFFSQTDYKQGVIDGAKWQAEQFEKDYTDLCNGIATAKGIAVAMAYDKGVADTKEQMVAKAIDGHVTFEFYGLDSKTYGTIVHDPICLDDFGLKDTDKVKVIAIKEDLICR